MENRITIEQMEYCMEAAALRPSLRSELELDKTHQAFFDDLPFSSTTTGVVSTDEFSVDSFFDFSEVDCEDCFFQEQDIEEEKEHEEQEEKDSFSDYVSSQDSQDRADDDNNSNSSGFSDSLFASELTVPVDDLVELEWLSQFADDSLSEVPFLYPAGQENEPENLAKTGLEPQLLKGLTNTSCLFPSWVPAKARTKRPRPASRRWPDGSPPTESSTSSSSSTPSCPVLNDTVQTIDLSNGSDEPLTKEPKKRPAVQTGEMLCSARFQRRCSHCQVQQTPQWRAGPLGAKTLCNACGVRYKSGRLFPEYRPACSPTFSGDIHSNSHRKVIEIRKRKVMAEVQSG
uniref:GATA transcription factor n=1 Tax=Rhizophora mucronata TaxID=61149 RepID=A0A2P2L4Z8_RHIMU